MALQRYALRLDSSVVSELEKISRKLAYARNIPVSWSELVREGCRWVVALEGRPPSEIANPNTASPR